MTNAEKFEEVFGFKPNPKVCYLPEDIECPLYSTCDICPYNNWLEEEYTGISPTGGESDDKCQECKKDWTKCTRCPVMMKRVVEMQNEASPTGAERSDKK